MSGQLRQSIRDVTERFEKRSRHSRKLYMDRVSAMRAEAKPTAHVALIGGSVQGINGDDRDQPLAEQLSRALSALNLQGVMVGGASDVSGQDESRLSFASRDVTALSTALAFESGNFGGGILLAEGAYCTAGQLIGALSFGHLPFLFAPAHAANTANMTAQLLLEMLGLQLPGASLFDSRSKERSMLTIMAGEVLAASMQNAHGAALSEIVSAKAIINAAIGLLATETALSQMIHLIAIARAGGLILTWDDFQELSRYVPTITKLDGDVSDYKARGGGAWLVSELISLGLLYTDVCTIIGEDLNAFKLIPFARGETLLWEKAALTLGKGERQGEEVSALRDGEAGLMRVKGDLGEGLSWLPGLAQEQTHLSAEAIVFTTEDALLRAYKAGELNRDFVAILPYQGIKASGFKPLKKSVAALCTIQQQGFYVALVTDGWIADTPCPLPIVSQLSPEAADHGLLSKVRTGDGIDLDLKAGLLKVTPLVGTLPERTPTNAPIIAPFFERSLVREFLSARNDPPSGGGFFNFE